jgi:N4-gp56 family major capsid protein
MKMTKSIFSMPLNLQFHAAGETKLTNMVNPEVMADMISAALPVKLRFAPLANVDTTLVGQAGDTITIPQFKYIGEADDLTEGVAMGTVVLETTTATATIKEAGKAVEITDKAVNSGYGDPIGEANTQIIKSINDKVDSDCLAALGEATLEYDGSAATIGYDPIVNAVDKFEEEDDEPKILLIHPLQKGTLRKDQDFIDNVPNAFMSGVIGEIAGCQVVAASKIKKNPVYTITADVAIDAGKTYYTEAAGVYTAVETPDVGDIATYYEVTSHVYDNFVVKPGALAIYLKERANIEDDRDILKRTTVIAASEYYVAELADDSKVVKLKTKA